MFTDLEEWSFQNPVSFKSNKTGKNEFAGFHEPKSPSPVSLQSEKTEKNVVIFLEPEKADAEFIRSVDRIEPTVEVSHPDHIETPTVVQAKKKTKRKKMPAMAVEEMNQILLKTHLSSPSTVCMIFLGNFLYFINNLIPNEASRSH